MPPPHVDPILPHLLPFLSRLCLLFMFVMNRSHVEKVEPWSCVASGTRGLLSGWDAGGQEVQVIAWPVCRGSAVVDAKVLA